MTKHLHLISRWLIKEEFKSEAMDVLRDFENMAREEKGTLLYMNHTPLWDTDLPSNPTPSKNEVLFFEIYQDKDAFKIHVDRQQRFMKKNGICDYFIQSSEEPCSTASMVEFLDYNRGFIKPNLIQ